MNCKPGDLAVIVRSKNTRNIGFITRCVAFKPTRRGEPAWLIDPPCPVGNYVDESGVFRLSDWAYDSHLLPIRDPGDDAKDEMLRPLPHEVTA